MKIKIKYLTLPLAAPCTFCVISLFMFLIVARNKTTRIPHPRNELHDTTSRKSRRNNIPSFRPNAVAQRFRPRRFPARSIQIRTHTRIRRHPRPTRHWKNVHRCQNRIHNPPKPIPRRNTNSSNLLHESRPRSIPRRHPQRYQKCYKTGQPK